MGSLGIDLGRKTTKASYVDDFGEVYHVVFSEGVTYMPSAVYLHNEVEPPFSLKSFESVTVGSEALRHGAFRPERLVTDLKPLLKSKYDLHILPQDSYEATYTPKDILVMIIQEVMNVVDDKVGRQELYRVAFTCSTDTEERDDYIFRHALNSVDRMDRMLFSFCGLIKDPAAAALSYVSSCKAYSPHDLKKTFLIYDLGGSFDASVVKVDFDSTRKNIEILATNGDSNIETETWVNATVDIIIDKTSADTGIDPDEYKNDGDFMIWLKETAGQVLSSLKRKEKVNVTVRFLGEKSVIEVTREDVIRGSLQYLDSTVSLLDYSLNESGRTIDDIDAIILTGGGASLFPVYEGLCAEYGADKVAVCDSPNFLALGAALFANGDFTVIEGGSDKSDDNREETSEDLIMGLFEPFGRTYYVKVGEGNKALLILDTKNGWNMAGSRLFATEKDDQTEFVVTVYEACREYEEWLCDDALWRISAPVTMALEPGLPKGSVIQVTLKTVDYDMIEVDCYDTQRNHCARFAMPCEGYREDNDGQDRLGDIDDSYLI